MEQVYSGPTDHGLHGLRQHTIREQKLQRNPPPQKKKNIKHYFAIGPQAGAFGIVGLGAHSTLQPGLEVEPMDLLRLRVTQNPQTRHVKALYTKRSQP